MPDKYKFVSVCDRDKPIQTNNKSTFTSHVAVCPTCREKLPKSILQELQPRLRELMLAKSSQPRESIENKTAQLSPEEVAKAEEQAKKAQLDALIKDSPSFQGLEKSVADIREQISTIGQMLGQKIEEGTARPSTEETGKQPPPGLPPTGGTPPTGGFGSGERPSPFGQSGPLPAAMRPGYEAGQKPAPEIPPPETPPKEAPPPGAKEPPSKEEKGAGLPDLDSPEQIEAMERYLSEQKRKLEGGEGKGKAKKVTDYMEPVDKGVETLEKIVNIFRGGGRAEPGASLAGTPIGDILNLMKAVNDLSISNVRGVVETMKALREGEKVARTVEAPKRSSSPRETSGGIPPETEPTEHVS